VPRETGRKKGKRERGQQTFPSIIMPSVIKGYIINIHEAM
jgi:hypothetical protein